MSVSVAVNTYTYSVTYLVDNILRSLQDVVWLSGLNPEKIADQWPSIQRALTAWMESKHLEKVILEVYDPKTQGLVIRWDLEIEYGWSDGNGRFWVDTEQLKNAIKKTGVWPSDCMYDILLSNKSGRPDVEGWGPHPLRSTDGFIKQSLGTTIEHSGLGAAASYYRKRS
jgi:hypothetical protein